MSEILWAVIIGGVIGVIGSAVTSIPSLIYNHIHWKKDFKLQYLITERIRREKQCGRVVEFLHKIVNNEDKVDKETAFEFGTFLGSRLPLKVTTLILDTFKKRDRDDEGGGKLHQEVSSILGVYLSEIDTQIEELTQ